MIKNKNRRGVHVPASKEHLKIFEHCFFPSNTNAPFLGTFTSIIVRLGRIFEYKFHFFSLEAIDCFQSKIKVIGKECQHVVGLLNQSVFS